MSDCLPALAVRLPAAGTRFLPAALPRAAHPALMRDASDARGAPVKHRKRRRAAPGLGWEGRQLEFLFGRLFGKWQLRVLWEALCGAPPLPHVRESTWEQQPQ